MSATKLASLAPELRRRVTALIAAAPGSITVFSGRRSPQRQGELWAEALAKYGSVAAARRWVAPPGSSKHETGEAADLAYGPGMRQWAHANARGFGLVFRLSNEPWHIERDGSAQVALPPPASTTRPTASTTHQEDDVTPQDIEKVAQRVAELLGYKPGRMNAADREDRTYKVVKEVAGKVGVPAEKIP